MFEERVVFFLYGIILCFTLGFSMILIATRLSDYQINVEEKMGRVVFAFFMIVGVTILVLIDIHYSIFIM